ncbi:hypothetical protein E4U40_006440 [Claviceps sp. LM458 group G5]|nr:hypothetical protein E4U40_006440 [Claviceps sp. LM458 group G5]
MTASVADLHWPSLLRYFKDYDAWKKADPTQRIKIARNFLRENPHLATEHFQQRLDSFFRVVLKEKFGYTDYWIRYELQRRGSVHAHWFIWTPETHTLDLNSEQSRNDYARFSGPHLTAINPDSMRVAAPTAHGAIQSRTREHKCSDTGCLRRRKGQNPENDSKLYCRFYFPRDLIDTAELSARRNPRDPMFCAKSNDTAMNHYSPLAIMACRANMDITPCTSIRVTLDCIAKYCTKAEVPTASYTHIAKSILPHVSDSRPVVSFAAKLLISLLRSGTGLQGSRAVLTLDCRTEQDRGAVVDVPDTDGNRQSTRPRRSLYVKYLERDVEYEATTFFTFLTRHNTNRPQPQRLADEVRDRILRYVPRYRSDPEHLTYSDYCRLKVVLHVPWRVYPSLPVTIDSTEYVTWEDAFHHLRNRDPRRLRSDYIDEIPTLEEEIDEFKAADLGEESNDTYFQELLDARLHEADHGNPDDLGSRPLDLTANWDAYVGKYSEEPPDLLLPTAKDEYSKSLKASTSINLDYGTEALNAEASLNTEQRLLFLTIVEHYERALGGLGPDPLRVNVDGCAGTGKSYTIQLVSSRLETMQRFIAT